jgi:hypothetical protein
MEPPPLAKAFTLIEPGPVVLVATRDGVKDNLMTISWTMVLEPFPRRAADDQGVRHQYRVPCRGDHGAPRHDHPGRGGGLVGS